MNATLDEMNGRSGEDGTVPAHRGSPGARVGRLAGYVVFPLLGLLTTTLGVGLAEWKIDRSVREGGLAQGLLWSRDVVPGLAALADDITDGNLPPVRAFLQAVRFDQSSVDRVLVFDARGRKIATADHAAVNMGAVPGDHDNDAVAVAQTGNPAVRLRDGGADASRAVVADVFLPVRIGTGELVAVAAVSLDRTAQATQIRADVYRLALKIASGVAGSGVLAFTVLMVGRRRARRATMNAPMAVRTAGSPDPQVRPRPAAEAEPRSTFDEGLDDWLVRMVDGEARRCAVPVEIECQLGLDGSGSMGDDPAAFKNALRAVVRHMLAVSLPQIAAGEGCRMVVTTGVTQRGLEVAIRCGDAMSGSGPSSAAADTLASSLADVASALCKSGGSLDVKPSSTGPGMFVIARWPAPSLMMEAS
jgi:hypothetical protein